ncbi:hypothetical protein [Absidia glauca]|uniref:HTH APSES-type domain-containing protein n=1 Tax=Absidia glauca TaxID=4829 RepID=A0A168NSH7_ABSGL|nr:hypothetical protein [Absidia glauca]
MTESVSYAPKLGMDGISEIQYSTSLDARGCIPVYEYTINNHPVMWDSQTGDVHLTGLRKAMGYSKGDMIKTLKHNPGLPSKKIRGGLLKIQGTWIPFEAARSLCLRTAWKIRNKLIPLFGPQFSTDCLAPLHPNYRMVALHCFQTPPIAASHHVDPLTKKKYQIKSPSFISFLTPSPSLLPVSSNSTTGSPYTTLNHAIRSRSPSVLPSPPTTMAITYLLNDDATERSKRQESLENVASTLISFGDGAVYSTKAVFEQDAERANFRVVPPAPALISPCMPCYSLALYMDDGLVPSCGAASLVDPSSPLLPSFSVVESPSPLASTSIMNTTAQVSWAQITPNAQETADLIKATLLLQSMQYQDYNLFRESAPNKVIVGGKEFSVVWN